MNDSIFRISLDIHEHGSQAVLKVKKTDTGRKLCISLRAGSTSYTIADDCFAVFKATKPDGSVLYNNCTIENNEIIYEFTEQTCTSVGTCRCEIALYGLDNKLITSPRFTLLVDGTIYPDGIVESTDEFSALTAQISASIGAAISATNASLNATNASVRANEAATTANAAADAAIEASKVIEDAEKYIEGKVDESVERLYVDDTTVSKKPWSSKNTVDKLCPSFEESGEWATCNPVEGSDLNIETTFRPVIPADFAPSLDNRETIGAWFGGTLYHGNKNLVDLKAVENVKQLTFTAADGTQKNQYKGFEFTLPAGMYTIRGTYAVVADRYVSLAVNRADGVYGGGGKLIWGSAQPAITVEIKDGDIIYIYNGSDTHSLATTKDMFSNIVNIMVEPGTVSSPYLPYNGNETTVDFGQGVYGGTYNWTTGVLSIDVFGEVIDGSSDEGWSYSTAVEGHMYLRRYINALSSDVYRLSCDCLPHNNGPYYGNVTGIRSNGRYIEMFFTNYTTKAEYFAFLDEYKPLIVYGLSTPITVQLTPQEFVAISGVNVCRSDMGETTVMGSESINSVIEKLTNAIIALGGNV